MKLPKLRFDMNRYSGSVRIPDEFEQLDPLLKKDMIQDWMTALESYYHSFDVFGNKKEDKK